MPLTGRLARLTAGILGLVAVLLPRAATAELVVTLKDGQVIRLPIAPGDVTSIVFEEKGQDTPVDAPIAPGKSGPKGLPPAPEPTPNSPLMKSSAGVTAVRPPQTLRVAPGSALSVPSAAAKIAQDGDTIEIEAALYKGDVAIWRQNNLTIRGVGGRAHLAANGRSAEGKAIWVLKGDNTRVENIEFSGATVGDLNGAGIRLEGAGLVVENCVFRGNQMGLMTGVNKESDVVIRKSEFVDNFVDVPGASKIGHNLYVGNVRSLTVTDSVFTGARIGHNVKSRAAKTTLLNNRIVDGPEGRASYLVDLAAGGVAILKNNTLHQGNKPENTTLVSYGAERMLHSENRLTIVENSFINDYQNGIFVQNKGGIAAEIVRNSFKGKGTVLKGPGTVVEARR